MGAFAAANLHAETLNLDQAVAKALLADPRIKEKESLVEAAQALQEEAQNANKLTYDVNFFVGVAPKSHGSIFTTDETGGNLKLRTNFFPIGSLAPWYNLQFNIIKPLYTFGKIENYTSAAKANAKVKEGDVAIQKGDIILDVNKAYYGYLAARDTRLLLEDVKNRVQKAIELVQGWLKDGNGNAKQSDLFALQTGAAIIYRYYAQAQGTEKIALDGLRVLTGVGLGNALEVADKRLAPVELPKESLKELQTKALAERPEMKQLEEGLNAKEALVKAKKSESHPNIYTGVIGTAAYTPGRQRVGPFFYDPFNNIGLTPIIGIKWDWNSGRQPAQVKQAQAEVDALVEKSAFAQQGIPFQVAEKFEHVQSYHKIVEDLAEGSRAGRRWMISTYADFEAGLEDASKVMTAFQGYVLAHTDYLSAVNEYNMYVAQLKHVTGDY